MAQGESLKQFWASEFQSQSRVAFEVLTEHAVARFKANPRFPSRRTLMLICRHIIDSATDSEATIEQPELEEFTARFGPVAGGQCFIQCRDSLFGLPGTDREDMLAPWFHGHTVLEHAMRLLSDAEGKHALKLSESTEDPDAVADEKAGTVAVVVEKSQPTPPQRRGFYLVIFDPEDRSQRSFKFLGKREGATNVETIQHLGQSRFGVVGRNEHFDTLLQAVAFIRSQHQYVE